jgi:hypothetical protein
MSLIPQLIEIGTLESIKQKAMVPFDGMRPVVLVHDSASMSLAVELAEGLVLQLLYNREFGPVQAFLFESKPGAGFPHLKRLLQEGEGVFGKQIVALRDCVSQLDALTEVAHNRYTLFATANCADVYAYNAVAPVPEPLYAVVLQGIDRAQSELHVLETLRDLCESGPAAGLIPVLLLDASKRKKETDNDYQRKQRDAFWAAVLPLSMGLDLRQTPVSPINLHAELWSLLERFQLSVGLQDGLRRQWVEDVLQRRKAQLAANTEQDFLEVEIGREGIRPAFFRMGERSNAYHALLGGATRSGKSTLLHNLILNACDQYSPDELQLWLFDFKDGVEWWIYEGLAHVNYLHTDSNDYDGVRNAFEAFCCMLQERRRLYRQCSRPVARLADYNRYAEKPLPRSLMVIDEAQVLFERSPQLRESAKKMLQLISRQGAADGLHLLLSTQSYQNVQLESDVKGQFHLRVGLQLATSGECRALMGQDNDAPLKLKRFMAVYNNDRGDVQQNRIISLHGLPDLQERLAALKQRYPGRQRTFSSDTSALPQPTSNLKPVIGSTADLGDAWDELIRG